MTISPSVFAIEDRLADAYHRYMASGRFREADACEIAFFRLRRREGNAKANDIMRAWEFILDAARLRIN
jgi:hypothetical protein